MRALLLLLALVATGCGGVKVITPPAEPVSTPSDAALAAREMVFAINTASPAIDAAVSSGQLSRAQAIREVTALRSLTTEIERLAADLRLWSQATTPSTREQLRATVLQRLRMIGWLVNETGDPSREKWRPLLEAYTRTLLAAGGAR